MKPMQVACVLILSFIVLAAARGDAQVESRERFVCTFGAARQRFIDVYRLAGRGPRGGGCRVDYTRDGATRQLWSASGDYAYCVKKAVGLVTKLSRGNFSCKPQTTENMGIDLPPVP